jgi:hypothetical protein
METSDNEQPPLFQKWSAWYWVVLGVLIFQVVLYSIITYAFA